MHMISLVHDAINTSTWYTHCMRKGGLSEPNGPVLWGHLGPNFSKRCFELHDFTYFRVLSF